MALNTTIISNGNIKTGLDSSYNDKEFVSYDGEVAVRATGGRMKIIGGLEHKDTTVLYKWTKS